jgi:ankyrin repeat protein
MEGAAPIVHPGLWTAVSLGQVDEARQLLVEGADVDEKGGPTASTPLHEAARRGYQEMAWLLVEHGADVSVENNDGETPLNAVCGTLDAITNGLYWNYDGYGAEHLDQLEIVELLLHNQADPSAKDIDGNTPLHSAAWAGDTNAVLDLLNHGADTSAKNSAGQTPLHWTAGQIHEQWHGHPDVALMLLERGVDISTKDNDGNTSLHVAAEHKHILMVRLLLEQGADVCAENSDGKTPLDVSTNILSGPAWKHEEVTAALLKAVLIEKARQAEEARQVTWGALVMGQHERLGAGSLIKTIPPELAKMILDRV